VNAAEQGSRPDRTTLGIVFMIGATVMFALASALSKWLVAIYPAGEVLFVRTVISLAVLALFILPATGLAVFRTQRLGAHVGRSVVQAAAQICLILALSMMPLADGLAINFSAPLVTALAAALILREQVGPMRWGVLFMGFVGVLIVTKPGADTFTAGALFAVGNAVLYGSLMAAVRGMSRTESAETLILYQHVLLTVLFGLLLVFGARWPDTAFDAVLMLGIGLTNVLGQYWWTRALHLAPASAVTPFYYFLLVWSMALGFLVWGDVPTAGLLIGSAIVIGSGLVLLWHESRQAPPPLRAA
jgi:drug/metabolite transporter (DMT)-like permease